MNPYTAEHQTHTNQQKSDYINILNPLYISNCWNDGKQPLYRFIKPTGKFD